MNLDNSKTNVMFNDYVTPEPIYVEDIALEVNQKYIYLGKILKLDRDNFEGEIALRV